MKAADDLVAEHEVILKVLDALESQAGRLRTSQPARPAFFLDAADFIRNFADGCHHHKEEGALFPALVESGMSRESGPVAVMLAEHEQGRAFTRAMAEAAGRLAAGETGSAAAVAENALGYAALLRQHIARENNVLFPMAARFIPAARQAALAVEFERIEAEDARTGVPEKYRGLAERLAREAAA